MQEFGEKLPKLVSSHLNSTRSSINMVSLDSEIDEGNRRKEEAKQMLSVKQQQSRKFSIFQPKRKLNHNTCLNVLILEAFEDHMSFLTTSMLQENGCVLTIARNGSEGLACLKNKPYDIVFANFSVVSLQNIVDVTTSYCICLFLTVFSFEYLMILFVIACYEWC